MNSKKLIVLVGPTAVGKTEVALRLAEHFKTEIFSADSRQIYKELEIGTAKPTPEELSLVQHHFINTHSIRQSYDAGAYGREALALIHTLFEKHNTLILCGGSGLYIKAVLEGFDEMPEIPTGIRDQIIAEYELKGLPWLQEAVREIDPDYFEQVDINNPHRLVRALELFKVSGHRVSRLRVKEKRSHDFQIIKIGLQLDRDQLYTRIDTRMDVMIEKGLFNEAEHFFPNRNLNALQTVGYREIFDYLEGKYDREEAIRLLKRNTRRYAKRQLTWFKKDPEVMWFQADQVDQIIAYLDNIN
ncbi:MAG TPA: tRNA (adenosine(37)-N6)-dimethylallyltransferase MiaA [Cyclobacteriaceae bacterium]|nr:tRNA (adenosine(37)-N6)-dimethylallyltransferase MiaA [Cyclobacteriaceae bacterium]